MSYSHKDVSQLENCATVRKMGRRNKNVSQLEKWLTVKKTYHN